MTTSEKVAFTQQLLNNNPKATDALVGGFLTKAQSVILRRYDPLKVVNAIEVPEEYEVLQCELSARYFLRMGGEPEMLHNENGVNRSYYSTNDEELLREIIPYAKVL